MKKESAQKAGITLVAVPCWWDGSLESLEATIGFQRPDLIQKNFLPISVNPPFKFFPSTELDNVGELMLASFPTSSDFISSIQNNSWWMGEKYDGIRCCWNPIHVQIYSRYGRELSMLVPILKSLPQKFIDGEIWFGRGQFSQSAKLYNKDDNFPWHKMRLLCFDAPAVEMQNKIFEKRYEDIFNIISFHHPFCIIAMRVMCKGSKTVKYFTKNIVENNGEGIIMRKVGSFYSHGRSPNLLKFKTVHSDAEALVIEPGLVTCRLKLPNGHIFTATNNNNDKLELKSGDVVTFSSDIQARRESPVNPKIQKIRRDISWIDVLSSYASDQKKNKEFTVHGQKYWTQQRMREEMIKIAKNYFNKDALLPSSWYAIPYSSLLKFKSVRIFVRKFESYFVMLQSLFPEIGLSASDLPLTWESIASRRKFFEEYATSNSFDPLVAENWYSQSRKKIKLFKDIQKVLHYHRDSISTALLDLFPEIGLQIYKFWNFSKKDSWYSNQENRRKFFEKYASDNQFDYSDPNAWYQQSKHNILAQKDSHMILYYHKNIATALVELFPNIGFDKQTLKLQQSQHGNINNQRIFFEKYAADHEFDPLIPSNWYSQKRNEIVKQKGAAAILLHYNNRVAKALKFCFPNIGLDESKFPWRKSLWKSSENRRKFFEQYAKNEGFDPLLVDNWYNLPKQKILSVTGASGVLKYHNNSLSQSLIQLFPEIIFHKSQFTKGKRRKFFEGYANANGFDALVPDNWYNQSKYKLLLFKGADRVLAFYDNNLTKALIELFPEIKLDESKFKDTSYWTIEENKRNFFIKFAKENKFDPFAFQNWTSARRHKLLKSKGIWHIMSQYKSNLSQALEDSLNFK